MSPLGSGACAGTTLPLDREGVARELGLTGITANSLDAVSDRDFAAEFEFAAAMTMVHLSRLAEDLILWTGEEFRLFHLSEEHDDRLLDDAAEEEPGLPRARPAGKTGRVLGDLLATLTIVKGLPLSYNRDLQETQEPLYDAADALDASLDAMTEVVAGLHAAPRLRAGADRAGRSGHRHRRRARPPRRPLPLGPRDRRPLGPVGRRGRP